MNHLPTLNDIQENINNQNWSYAKTLLNEYRTLNNPDDMYYILESSIYVNDKNYEKAINSITEGLKLNYMNYELYFILGNIKEALQNFEQALFCYENAVFYCKNNDKYFLLDYIKNFKETHNNLPGKVAIIIVSYENLQYTKICVNSIKLQNLEDTYEIIVIDNNSTDGTKEWLSSQKDIKYIINNENLGFPAACNQGINLAEENSDIFLLNNDTIIMSNSIFCLKMGLYEKESIGAAGSVSNFVAYYQQISDTFDSTNEYFSYCEKNNIYDFAKCEYRVKLIGFSMLFKRNVLNLVGLLDENFGLGHYEDDDISIRIILSGYKLLLCHNSFIYHFGHRSFAKYKLNNHQQHSNNIKHNLQYITNKWGIDLNYYSYIRYDLINLIDKNPYDVFNVLDIGCGCGSTLLQINFRFKKANLYGFELSESAVKIGSSLLDIVQGNIEDKNLSFPEKYFDYIILGDILEDLHDPLDIIKYISKFLKDDGYILASISNILNYTVIIPLLKGSFKYTNSGTLDKSHLRFFTKNEILTLFLEANYTVKSLLQLNVDPDDDAINFIDKLASIDNDIKVDELTVSQYLIKANKIS